MRNKALVALTRNKALVSTTAGNRGKEAGKRVRVKRGWCSWRKDVWIGGEVEKKWQ